MHVGFRGADVLPSPYSPSNVHHGLCCEQPLLATPAYWLVSPSLAYRMQSSETHADLKLPVWLRDPPPTSGAGIIGSTTPSAVCHLRYMPSPFHKNFESAGKPLREGLLGTTSPGHACCREPGCGAFGKLLKHAMLSFQR